MRNKQSRALAKEDAEEQVRVTARIQDAIQTHEALLNTAPVGVTNIHPVAKGAQLPGKTFRRVIR